MGATRKAKITKSLIDSLPRDGTVAVVWDRSLAGFGVRWQGRSWRYVYRFRAFGVERWVTIGKHGDPWTPDTARDQARLKQAAVIDGKDPAAIRDFEKGIPTLRAFSERYLEEHAVIAKKASSVAMDRSKLRVILKTDLAKMRMDKITRPHIIRFHLAHRKTPVHANRCLALLSHMFTMSERWGLRPDHTNPCFHVPRFKEHPRKRFLSAVELARVGTALNKADEAGKLSPYGVAVIRLLILTGCRLSEATNLEWKHVDLEGGALRLPESKTGEKNIPLNAPAKKLLADLPRLASNPFVFPGLKRGVHITHAGIEGAWQLIRKDAELEDVHLHDLRHTFGSFAAASGESLVIIGAILGHTTAATTLRYSHLSPDPVLAASERVAATIASAMKRRG